jgi:RNA ligase (TIGR02306 family)
MERKLATIRQIANLEPIPGADQIELATIDGWKVVVAKNVNHKINDYVVYCEVDSFLPIKPEFEFLRKSSYKKMGDQEGFRLKTIRLRGQISQGLILPLDDVIPFPDVIDYMVVGKDVTELLEIVKYEPPIPAELAGKVKGNFPSFIPKTDEERIQNLTSEYETWRIDPDNQFYVTEKLNGSSATYYINGDTFGVCSRNLELLETEGNTFWKVARKIDLENKMRSLGISAAFQGELIGEGIQGNPYKIKGQTVRFYNMYDIQLNKYHSLNTMKRIIVDEMGLEMVPILETNYKLPETIEELLSYADGKSVLNSNFDREGLVIRSSDRKISFKAISNKFLLKHEK